LPPYNNLTNQNKIDQSSQPSTTEKCMCAKIVGLKDLKIELRVQQLQFQT